MTVNVSKPVVNVREKLAELDKPTGIAGEAMLRAETVAEQQALIGVGRKNLIINGDFQVSQRGDYTSAISAPNAYVLDRWLVDRNGTATVQHTTGHDISGTPTICKAIKLVQTVTGNNYLGIRQKIENPEQYIGRTVTYSAWVRSNTPNARIEFYIPGSTTHTYIGPNHSGSGEWEYLSFTATIKSSGASTTSWTADVFIDNGAYGVTTITAGDYVEATMLQMELGNVATPFEHRSYGEELALCQRYYQRISHTIFGVGYNESTSEARGIIYHTRKRATPSVSSDAASLFCNVSTGTTVAATSLSFDSLSLETFRYICVSGNVALVDGGASQLQVYSGTPSIYIDAEL